MPSQPPNDAVRIFLSYAREDYAAVSVLYDRLEALGLRPWMDKVDILPGERWETKLAQAIHESHFFLAFLSANSVAKRGYLQREFKQALDLWQEKVEEDIYLIPVRLDECEVPETLRAFQWVNLYEDDAWWALLRAIRVGAERLGLTLPEELKDIPKRGRPAPRAPTAAATADVLTVETKPRPAPAEMTRVSPDLLLVEKPIRLELVRIPAGYFLMGTRAETIPDFIKRFGGKQEWHENAVPQHRVYLPDYYTARVPVTVAQFRAFFEATGYQTTAEQEGWGWMWTGKWEQVQGASWRHPFGPDSDVLRKSDHPVTQVSWHDARAFCEWAGVRLPSEAEWEKAARGSDGRDFSWGNQAPTTDLCNFGMNVKDTTPVGSYPAGASPYGLLDMAGNVWEWTSSLYKPYPYDPKDGRENLIDEAHRVQRGGSFSLVASFARCAARNDVSPVVRSGYDGFRVGFAPPSASGL